MKTLFFDTGPVISMTMNHILWVLPKLKKTIQWKILYNRISKERISR